MKKYAVTLLLQKCDNGYVSNKLVTRVVLAVSEAEALGAVVIDEKGTNKEENKDFTVATFNVLLIK